MGYTSLKDLYAESVAGKAVPLPPRQQVLFKEQTGKTFVPGNEYVPQTPWSEFNLPSELFEKISKEGKMDKEGTGRGEYSVACILWGLNSKEQVEQQPARIIQGGGESFDVSGPDGRKYEVKELDKAVRTGTEGAEVLATIVNTTVQMLDTILKEFATVDAAGKQTINNMILNSNVVKNTILNRSSQKKYFDIIKDRWNLEDYLNDVKRKAISELSKGILMYDQLDLGRYAKDRPQVIFSLKQLVDALNEIAAAPATMSDTPGTLNTAVKDIADTIHKHYKVHGDEKEKQFFEREAEIIDRALIQKRCKVFQKCTDATSFRNQIKAINLNETLNTLRSYTKNIVKNIFPNDGLFAVNRQGFQYIPHDKLDEHIEFDTISSGKIKIKQKK